MVYGPCAHGQNASPDFVYIEVFCEARGGGYVLLRVCVDYQRREERGVSCHRLFFFSWFRPFTLAVAVRVFNGTAVRAVRVKFTEPVCYASSLIATRVSPRGVGAVSSVAAYTAKFAVPRRSINYRVLRGVNARFAPLSVLF